MCNIVYNTNEQLIKDVQNIIDVLFLVIHFIPKFKFKIYTRTCNKYIGFIHLHQSYVRFKHTFIACITSGTTRY